MRKLPTLRTLALVAGLVLAAQAALAQPPATRPRTFGPPSGGARPGRPAGRDLAVGDLAPDFELPRLDPFLKQDRPAKREIERIRLSALRGRRPVVLVFSSYT